LAKDKSSAGVESLVPFGEVIRLVMTLLGVAVRCALSKSEREAMEDCLRRAIDVSDKGVGGPVIWRRTWHWKSERAWRLARQQVSREIFAAAGLIEASYPVRAGSEIEEISLAGPDEASVEVLKSMARLAHRELKSALVAEELTPWSHRLAATLAEQAERRWEVLKAPQTERYEGARRAWTAFIMNDAKAGPGDVKGDVFDDFGQRVGLHFAANMAAHKDLSKLVGRLDELDRQRAEVAQVTATQNLRIALWVIAIVAGVGAAALLEVAVDQTI
jgi:hypothetical protein